MFRKISSAFCHAHRTVQDDAVSQVDPVVQHHPGVKDTASAQARTLTDHATRTDDDIVRKNDVAAQDCRWMNVRHERTV